MRNKFRSKVGEFSLGLVLGSLGGVQVEMSSCYLDIKALELRGEVQVSDRHSSTSSTEVVDARDDVQYEEGRPFGKTNK